MYYDVSPTEGKGHIDADPVSIRIHILIHVRVHIPVFSVFYLLNQWMHFDQTYLDIFGEGKEFIRF